MKNLPAITNFVKPYFIKELGCEGLTNYDIAKALNRPVKDINRKIERPEFTKCCKVNQYDLVTESHQIQKRRRGRPRRIIAMEERAAKALMCMAGWEEGYRYLDFLFDCEAVATEELPKLRKRIADLESKSLPKRKKRGQNRQGLSLVPMRADNLLAPEFALVGVPYIWVATNETTPLERELGQLHRAQSLEQGWRGKREEIQQKITKFVYQLEQMNLLSEREDNENIEQMKLN